MIDGRWRRGRTAAAVVALVLAAPAAVDLGPGPPTADRVPPPPAGPLLDAAADALTNFGVPPVPPPREGDGPPAPPAGTAPPEGDPGPAGPGAGASPPGEAAGVSPLPGAAGVSPPPGAAGGTGLPPATTPRSPVVPAVPDVGPGPAGAAAPIPPASAGPRPAGEACTRIDVSSRVEPPVVAPGGQVTWVITLANPNAGELSRATLVHTVTATPGVVFSILHSDPVADSTSPTGVTFDDLGPVGAGRSETARVTVRVEPGSAAGRLTGDARASGDCRPAADPPAAGTVAVEGRAVTDGPEVVAAAGAGERRPAAAVDGAAPMGGAPAGSPLPDTGGPGWGARAAALVVVAAALRRAARRPL